MIVPFAENEDSNLVDDDEWKAASWAMKKGTVSVKVPVPRPGSSDWKRSDRATDRNNQKHDYAADLASMFR